MELLDQAPRPYLVVAIGGCPATGLMFRDSYNFDSAPSEYIPIDAFIPGCPPKPEAIISGVVTVIGALREGAVAPKCLDADRDQAPLALPAQALAEGENP
ncbi:MAG: hypothetical protein HKP16_04370 [Xanthomonadales bacterium]|nr:hypothetical protein [Xanthomonadales bacterium]